MNTEHETVGDVESLADSLATAHTQWGAKSSETRGSLYAHMARSVFDRIERAHARESAAQVGVPAALADAVLAELRACLGTDGTVYQRVRAMLSAAPAPAAEPNLKPAPEADEPGCDDCDGYEGEGGHCLMCGKDLGAAPQPAPSDEDLRAQLADIQRKLEARGIVSVRPHIERGASLSRALRDTVEFLAAYLDGRHEPAAPIGDSNRVPAPSDAPASCANVTTLRLKEKPVKVTQQRYSWERSRGPESLSRVVQDHLYGDGYSSGELETLRESTDKTREFLGALTELLVSKGLLSLEEVGRLLGASLEPA